MQINKDQEDYRKSRNNFIWLGIALEIIARFIPQYWNLIAYVPAGIFILIGCYFWTKYKNISLWFFLFGVIAPIGFIPLALIKRGK